jgi:serine phosphatase RsbU (regulator of sigma subunit)
MSDGLAERFSPDGEMFGYERARAAFSEAAAGSPAQIVDHLVELSDEWAKNDAPTDDMTFVVMRAKSDIGAGDPPV